MEKIYKSKRIVDKLKWVIVDETGKVVNNNPSKEELKELKKEPRTPQDTRNCRQYTDKQLLDILRQSKKDLGRLPTQEDFTSNPEYPDFTTYRKRFGSWNKALEIAFGVKRENGKSYSEKELLDILRQSNKDLGRPPTMEDFTNNSEYPSAGTYQRVFGSWSNALKLVCLDVDSMVKKGIIDNHYQKGRCGEMVIRDHFKDNPIDLAGGNCTSHCDGICPNGKTYDVKSSKLYYKTNYLFDTDNEYKEEIEIYYLLAFRDKEHKKLDYGWRIPSKIVRSDRFRVGLDSKSRFEFTVENMKQYEITEELREVLTKYGFFKS